LAPAIVTQALQREDYILAPESGIFEAALDLASKVKRGQTVGYIHHMERPTRAPEVVVAQTSGYLLGSRAPCLTQQGDCVAVIATPVNPRQVLQG
jgi:predicted deacylase